MRFNLEQLGAVGFQDLAAALTVATFGSGVQVMGAGRDGGRDLYHRGPLIWKRIEEQLGEVWDGYTVFQAKHKAELAARPTDNVSWLWGQIRAELNAWASHSDRQDVPDYLLVITNVSLTPTPGSGGHDLTAVVLEKYVEGLRDGSRDLDGQAEAGRKAKLARISKIKKLRVWDGNQIQTLLTVHGGVRQAFPAFLAPADIFASLPELVDKLPLDKLEPGLRAHARTTLMGEGFLYFDEAGSGDGRGIPVHEVAIDLPVTYDDGTRRSTALHHVLNRAEHILKPKITTQKRPRHLVLAGAPGNGKTTISKFLVQIFRASMLNGAANLSADHVVTIAGVARALARLGCSLPRHRRWPMRIDLAEYAEEGGLNEDETLLRWIARKVSKRSNAGEVVPWALQSWMRQWPWLLVLDGLDEVTEPLVRKRLIERVTEFVNDAEAENCDVLVVLTTRPVGYTENIAPTQFERIDLDYLELPEAIRYGTLATQVRLGTDADRIERVTRQLRKAADDEALRHLLRTPLQVLILTIIVDGAGHLAPDRYSLFWGYYDTVFKRERAKIGGLHHLLQEHEQQIQELHQRVGFELQVRSEAGDRSTATLTAEELRQITWHVLNDVDFQPSGKDAGLVESIFSAATRRLVLLAPRGDNNGYGFDVRSLQELMAAMHLTTGPLDKVIARLRTAGPSPHWRNTWLFAAGRLFATPQPHQHEAVVHLVQSIDEAADDRLATAVPIGPRLALEIVEDGMARSIPKWRDPLIAHGLRVLDEPPAADISAITRGLVRFADTGDDQRCLVADALRDALGNHPISADTATKVQELIPAIAREAGTRPAVQELAHVLRRPNVPPPSEQAPAWDEFNDEIATYPASETTLAVLRPAADALQQIAQQEETDADAIDAIIAALADTEAAKALASALTHILPREAALMRILRDIVLPTQHRRPIGADLRS
ncbi:hypothetical protein FDG2_4184 [Candidatus Protofrankia californiensis]|uniref:Nephrocystin 3-like N-terminal domain-containing protein n=1 Tax=Candidatus Protofrankia californiensis TaxID=1839754 RepID=A0A1C3P3U9_9ACTN|nr:hypothetical protein FDG2_4184 [Candidatus Protofrankia californiensis]